MTALEGKTGGGGSLETVTVTITAPLYEISYLDENGECHLHASPILNSPITCVKNSLLLSYSSSSTSLTISGGSVVVTSGAYQVICLTENTTIATSGGGSVAPDRPK